MRTLRKDMKGEDVKQVQELLIANGYDLPRFGIDGHYGNETISAVRSFQEDRNLTVDGIYGPASHSAMSNGQLSENFHADEFRCKGTGTLIPIDRELIDKLEQLRSELGNSPVSINSGYRSPSHNRNVGGALNSQHVRGTAADIVVSGYTPAQVHRVANRIFNNGGVGSYNTFTHVDTRGHRARW